MNKEPFTILSDRVVLKIQHNKFRGGVIFFIFSGVSIDPTAPYKMYYDGFRAFKSLPI